MGRRSVNSTKAGKFMNPTDQARKEARRRELKKNKKQRQIVREAVIKQKDPRTIIVELDNLDKFEFDTNNPPPYSSKVIEEKRKKLRENFKKIYQFYQKEDPKHAFELRSIEQDYERRHMQLRSMYESVMQAQRVKLDDIPLPDLDAMPMAPPPLPPLPPSLPLTAESTYGGLGLGMIPLPPLPSSQAATQPTKKSILKRSSDGVAASTSSLPPGVEPPGPPPGSPPALDEFECDDDDDEDDKDDHDVVADTTTTAATSKKSIRFGATIVETVAPPPMPPLPSSSSSISNPSMQGPLLPPPPPVGGPAAAASMAGMAPSSYPSATAAVATQRLQGSQAAAIYASKHAQKVQEQASRVAQQIYIQQEQQQQQQLQQNQHQQQLSTIEAKPVLRNKLSEITRFVPTNLIVRRDPNKPMPTHQHAPVASTASAQSHNAADYDFMGKSNRNANNSLSSATKSTDSAYEDFMKEIDKLL